MTYNSELRIKMCVVYIQLDYSQTIQITVCMCAPCRLKYSWLALIASKPSILQFLKENVRRSCKSVALYIQLFSQLLFYTIETCKNVLRDMCCFLNDLCQNTHDSLVRMASTVVLTVELCGLVSRHFFLVCGGCTAHGKQMKLVLYISRTGRILLLLSYLATRSVSVLPCCVLSRKKKVFKMLDGAARKVSLQSQVMDCSQLAQYLLASQLTFIIILCIMFHVVTKCMIACTLLAIHVQSECVATVSVCVCCRLDQSWLVLPSYHGYSQ